MSLCRFYPQPSDRMAILWSLMPIEDAIVLEYGPAGTTHFGGGMYSSLGLSLRHTLFTTHISEDDVIMGDVSRLENAILELDEAYSPRVIFVVASAVIAVIGTDIEGVCHYMQDRVNARLVTFSDGGFRGDYTSGLRAVYRLLAKEMTGDAHAEKKPFAYQILGASAGSYRIRSDVWEIRQLMEEAFGYQCRMVMGLESSVRELEGCGESTLNLVIRCEATEAAEILKEKFGTDYLYGVPYGYWGTLCWLEQISALIQVPVNPVLKARLQAKRMDLRPMGGPMGNMRPPIKAVLQGDYDLLTGLSGALSEMNVEVEAKICSHSLKETGNPADGIRYFPTEKERIDYFQELHGRWILGSIEAEQVSPDDNTFTCVSAPFVGRPQIATHLPLMGERGMDYLRECMEEQM